MPVLTLIGLIFTGIKVAMAIFEWLQAHPEVTGQAKAALARASVALEEAHGHVETALNTPEAP